MNTVPAEAAPSVREDLRLASMLGLAAALATAALFPYLLDLMPEIRAKIHIPMALLVLAQSLQAAVLLTLLSFIGLRLGRRAQLDAPWLRALLNRQALPPLPWRLSLWVGIGAALAVIGLSLLTDPYLPAMLHPHAATPVASAWKGLLASFYGGIGEELQLRLFLMTLVVWAGVRLSGKTPTSGLFWFAILLAALLFGAGHLPAAQAVWPMTGMVVFRTVLLNTVAGVAFGWLYWRRGLEAAMLGHFCADLVLHVAAPLLSGP